MTITVSIVDLFHFCLGPPAGLLFSAHLFPSAQNVNLYFLLPATKATILGAQKRGSLAMSEIQTGDRVRMPQNQVEHL